MRVILILLVLIAACAYLLLRVVNTPRTKNLRILVQVLLTVFSVMLAYISLLALLQA